MTRINTLATLMPGMLLLASACEGVSFGTDDDPLDVIIAGLSVDPKTAYAIVGLKSRKCLQPAGASLSAQTKIVLAGCEESTAQEFMFSWVEGRYYSITNVASGLCLDVSGRQTTNGAAVVQNDCSGATNQQFAVPNTRGGASVSLTARHSVKRLDVASDGTSIIQSSSTGASSQQFVLSARRHPDGGTRADAGSAADGGPTVDGGTGDGGSSSDGGTKVDGGSEVDGGPPVDGGAPFDAGQGSSCASPSVRITEVPVETTVVANEDEAALKPVAIAPIPSGGSRVAFLGSDGKAHVITLKADDTLNPSAPTVALAVKDLGDLLADETGGVLLATRDAQGGGTLNCGNPANLCFPPNPPIPCYDMYLVRFDGATERWATKLTTSSSALPPYSTGPTGGDVFMIWWYAHHGRLATDGTNYAAYFGVAASASQGACIDIHQGNRMQVVNPSGALLLGHDSFDWGCSHSGYERIAWDPRSSHFVTVCKTDNNNRITFAPSMQVTIYPVDLWYSNLGDLALATSGGYWLTTSNIRSGQPSNTNGLADVHLLHFSSGAADKDVTLASEAGLNNRAPNLATYGAKYLLATWETSPATGDLAANDRNRTLYMQVRDGTTGAAVSGPIRVAAKGNRYHPMRAFPDGSVAFASAGTSAASIKIVRVLPCQ